MSKKYELLKPTNDYVFKRIFGYVGNEDITKDFLSAILGKEVKSVRLDCKEILEQDLENDKFGILDIHAEIDDGIQCDIEMQVADYKDIENRMLYYWSKMYIQGIRRGEHYSQLKKTILILVADYNLEKLKNMKKTISKWKIMEENEKNVALTDMLEFYIIELPKLEKYQIKNEHVNDWFKFIKNPEVLKMNEIERNKALQKAKEELAQISADEKEQYLAEKRFLYKMDKKALEDAGYDKGMKAGQKKEKEKIARKLLELNLPIEQIQEATGLSKEEVERLRN